MSLPEEFVLINNRLIYEGRIFKLYQETVQLPDQEYAYLDVVYHPGGVGIIAVDGEDILLVQQYRHAIRKVLMEIPAGTLEPGEHPEVCAMRELREETGMAASTIQLIGTFYLAPGYSSEKMYIFLATDLYQDALTGDKDEFIAPIRLTIKDVYDQAEKGNIQDAKTLAAIAFARPFFIEKKSIRMTSSL